MRLEGKLAVITAAASGMGKAGVELFLREGAKVVAVDYDESALQKLKEEMAQKGHDLAVVVADLSTEKGAADSVHAAARFLGGIDIFWAHAGTPGPAGIEQLDMEAYRKSLALNVDSAVICAGEVAQYMRARKGGSLIFTASISGIVGSRFSPTYSLAKFAIVGLAKSLAQTFAPDNIRVNVICPGLTQTPMASQFTSRVGDAREAAENEKKLVAAVPLGRIARPVEIAHAALWLGSDDSSFVTGVDLPVDGGFTCM